MSVPNIKILGQAVSEKSLTEKKFTDKQTNIVTEKAKTIYPLYTSYAGGININARVTVLALCTSSNVD